MFGERELQRRGVSARIIERIARKRRGAQSGSAGYRLEDFFGVSALLVAAADATRTGSHSTFWIRQNSRALVDDVITGNGSTRFHQLKSGRRPTWSSAVRSDFIGQADLCQRFQIVPSELILVVCDQPARQRLQRERPRTQPPTSVAWFPRMTRTSDLATAYVPARTSLATLCAGRPSTGDLASIAAAAFTTALDRSRPAARYPVAAFLRAMRRIPVLPLRSPFDDRSPRWRRAAAILARIPKLRVSIADGFIVYDYASGLESGRGARCGSGSYARFVARILKYVPTTFDDFERLL